MTDDDYIQLENQWFQAFRDGTYSARTYSTELDGLSLEELTELNECLEQLIEFKQVENEELE